MKKYICCGESIRNGIKQGLCGDVHTIDGWIKQIYGNKADDFFDGCSDAEILKYLLKYAGKRLEIIV